MFFSAMNSVRKSRTPDMAGSAGSASGLVGLAGLHRVSSRTSQEGGVVASPSRPDTPSSQVGTGWLPFLLSFSSSTIFTY